MAFQNPIKAVLIDLDGTLIDTLDDLADAANAMLAVLGRLTFPAETIRGFVGKGIAHLVGRCLGHAGESGSAEAQEALRLFRRYYAELNGRKARVYPGVREGLDRLSEAGLKLACVTNKAAAFTLPLLASSGLAPYFDLVISGDTLAHRKPHPQPLLHACGYFGIQPAQAVMIGDSDNDVDAARAAGCPVYGVPYGYRQQEDVRSLDADVIVCTLEEAARRILDSGKKH